MEEGLFMEKNIEQLIDKYEPETIDLLKKILDITNEYHEIFRLEYIIQILETAIILEKNFGIVTRKKWLKQ